MLLHICSCHIPHIAIISQNGLSHSSLVGFAIGQACIRMIEQVKEIMYQIVRILQLFVHDIEMQHDICIKS